ncbi:MAG: class I SAM-dependent methyltransferase [Nitrospirota bacterium]
MGIYAKHVFPHLMDWAMGSRRLQEQRREALMPLHGEVLEIGFGTGLNLPHYPSVVARLIALEPARLLPRKVSRRMAAAPMPVMIVQGSAEHLPFHDRRFDCVVSTWTLCTIPDVPAALREIGRVLKPGGRFVFLEHGRSNAPTVARWQDRLNPLQQRIGAGCNMNRPIDRLITEAGLTLGQLERFQMPGMPRLVGEMYRGVASAH